MARIVTRVVPSGKWKFIKNMLGKMRAPKSMVLSTRRNFLELKIEVHYFFKVSARNLVVRFQASAASSARYPSLLLGFSKACPALG
jgi:hypothetical protein